MCRRRCRIGDGYLVRLGSINGTIGCVRHLFHSVGVGRAWLVAGDSATAAWIGRRCLSIRGHRYSIPAGAISGAGHVVYDHTLTRLHTRGRAASGSTGVRATWSGTGLLRRYLTSGSSPPDPIQ